jgi:hypothetical protein
MSKLDAAKPTLLYIKEKRKYDATWEIQTAKIYFANKASRNTTVRLPSFRRFENLPPEVVDITFSYGLIGRGVAKSQFLKAVRFNSTLYSVALKIYYSGNDSQVSSIFDYNSDRVPFKELGLMKRTTLHIPMYVGPEE